MKIENFELKLEKPQEYIYLAGEEIKGKLNIITKEKTRIARLSLRTLGSTFTYWQYSNNIEYESKEINLDLYKDLTEELSIYCDKAMELNCGEYKLEFALPINAISSFNEVGYGNIKYSILAILDIAEDCGESEIVSESEIQLKSLLTLDSPHFLNSAYSTEEIVTDRVCNILCFCKSQKRIKLTLRSSFLGLLPGETCKLSLIMEKQLKKSGIKKLKQVKCILLFCNFVLNINLGIKLSLCQQIDFMACRKNTRNVWDRRLITRAIQSYTNNSNNIKCDILSESEQQIQFHIPCNLPPTSVKENGLINFSYFFRIEIEQNFDIILPIVIGSFRTIQ